MTDRYFDRWINLMFWVSDLFIIFLFCVANEREENIDYDFAQNELLLNEFDSLGGKLSRQ